MVGLNPGELREIVTFQKLGRIPNDNGGSDPVWTLAFRTSAKVVNDKPARNIEAVQLVLINTRKVVIRYSVTHEVEMDMRMQWQGKDYQIVSIDEVDGTKMLVAITVTRAV